MVTGGRNNPNNVITYNRDGFVLKMPSLIKGRIEHGCTQYNTDKGEQVGLITLCHNVTYANHYLPFSIGSTGNRWN